ncbi:TetR/AcrR family transcriptional regulator [Labedella populi]|uniref:TetR/AcrR family transcriptional regulator n=1 Tax=Labedella populi TaxID=2498850 RepID=A0A3S4A2C9_9MICO|nr:TetR/AcrR family transcriptional regulator [Labedella populi]RWZ68190.1 TetR/AcrR family transcriptional regulator [Labedella populi]
MAVSGRPRGFDPDRALDDAVDVFWRRGFDGASMSELTAAMGISRPSLYAAFGDKTQLFQSALRRYVERSMGYVTDALARPTAREVAESFLTGNAVAVTMPGRPAGCLSVQAAVATEGSTQLAALTENRARIESLFAERFRRAVDEGDLAEDEDPDELAAFLITVTSGFAIRAADGTTRETLLSMVRRIVAGFPTPLVSPRSTEHPSVDSKETARV